MNAVRISAHKNIKGFTLIEVTVAIAIFALLGIGCYRVVNGMANSRDSITAHSDSLRELSRAVRILDRDFQQIIGRNVLDENGEQLSAVMSGEGAFSGNGLIAEITRQGARNPLLSKRAEVIRVGYAVERDVDRELLEEWGFNKNNKPEGDYLLRYLWPVIDRGDSTEMETQLLLANVESFSIEYLDQDEEERYSWDDEWPPIDGIRFTFELGEQQTASNEIPYGIKLMIESRDYGVIERVYDIHN